MALFGVLSRIADTLEGLYDVQRWQVSVFSLSCAWRLLTTYLRQTCLRLCGMLGMTPRSPDCVRVSWCLWFAVVWSVPVARVCLFGWVRGVLGLLVGSWG
jgi:hypothetical protein